VSRPRRHLLAALTIAAVTALLNVTTAAPGSAATTATAAGPVIRGTGDSLYPEGVAWDPTRRAFLVGSARHGTVSVLRPDGAVSTLVSDERMVSTFGLAVDAARGRLLVTYSDLGVGERSTPRTTGQLSGLGIFDLATATRT
jgi:DNA-binding beta-propeller fold protein YncE